MAFGHLLATGMLHDVLLFGAFLLWAVMLFIVSRRRDRRIGTTCPAGTRKGDVPTALAGVAAWVVFRAVAAPVADRRDPMSRGAGSHLRSGATLR